MNSRRKFVKQGTLASASVLALNPFDVLAGMLPSPKKLFAEGKCLTLLHSAEPEVMTGGEFITYVSRAKRIASPIILNASQNIVANTTIHLHTEELNANYSVLNQNGILTGFINITEGETGVIERVNHLAAYLKNEKKCNLVTCVSHLGFKKKAGMDDLALAAASENIDIIIGGNTSNYTAQTMVVRNSKKEEVIIQSSFKSNLPCGKLEIAFDETGVKKHVHVASKFYNDAVVSLA
jgi:hypothetical protein